MKYYIIAGEASGDLHAAHLIRSLKAKDPEAQFRCFGGDLMAAEGAHIVKHYRELAYMGFVPVLLHLPTIMNNMRMCKRDIREWMPDVVILVDYPGFNLSIAKYAHKEHFPVYYYISPKIWAWKEWRIKQIKKNVDEMFSILPFEVDFYEGKHHYPIHYVGNPTECEVREFRKNYKQTFPDFCTQHKLDTAKPIVALLAGSRQQEIKDNLPAMIEATRSMEDYQFVLAGAPSITDDYYSRFIKATHVRMVKNTTYPLLSHSTAAIVTSGTATLETALFDVPQVVCYETPLPHIIRFAFNHIIKVKYISLVNLIADKEIVQELLADRFSVDNIRNELLRILPSGNGRKQMLDDYDKLDQRLGSSNAPDKAAQIMIEKLKTKN
ncbi:MAG: lipid-A-disaccharide synthase [Prevotella sp.]|nr:lipid-A-disaccharide synthase [Prevotella sp.]